MRYGIGRCENPMAEHTHSTSRPASGDQRPVLLVEDDVLNAMYTEQVLRRMGLPARVAGSGRAALEIMASLPVRAVILDIELPDMDGFEVLRRVREARHWATSSDVPVFALTGHERAWIKKRDVTGALSGILSKPISEAALAEALAPSANALTGRSLGADTALAREFASIFLDELPGRLAGLRHAMDTDDLGALARHGHSLKSTTAMVGATRASIAAMRLEAAAVQGCPEDCRSLVADLERELHAARTSLDA
ncbi:response regulator receiver and Hpt phospho transfer protein [Alkalidesulfovibrio alkalitolerans DSM 16529]|uniref:Response regulator receiver and Hpt phospho transfer protein n=2 Tax=Alkalidesulfovibrio alkalitolerans TaxID=293256 RepID=S7T3A8_9BACT|nr:response regulator receiver and Hpt phospho transfer protein [Alkalidesulfovibrio alkalitolerans DSM 16529]